MKLKKSYMLLIVMSIFLLISIGSVCAADSSATDADTQLTDSGSDIPLSDDGTEPADPTNEETDGPTLINTSIATSDVSVNESEPIKIPIVVRDNESQTITIGKANITVMNGKTSLKFNYNNSEIIITDKLTAGKYNLIITYLGSSEYANSSANVLLKVYGNYTLKTPTSVNANSTKIVEIPVNVTNGVDTYPITASDFNITLSYKEGNATINRSITNFRIENSKLIFTLENNNFTSGTVSISYRNRLNATVTLKNIVNAIITPVNTTAEYQSGEFVFKVTDADTGEVLANKTIKAEYSLKTSSVTFIMPTSAKTDSNGILRFNNRNMYVAFDVLGVALNVGTNTLTLSSSDVVITSAKKVNVTIVKADVKIIATNLTHEYSANESAVYTIVNAKTGEAIRGVILKFEIPKTTQKTFYAYSDSNGRVTIPTQNLVGGNYEVTVCANDSSNLNTTKFDSTIKITKKPTVISASDATFDYGSGTYTFKVTDKSTGKVISGAIVKVLIYTGSKTIYEGWAMTNNKGIISLNIADIYKYNKKTNAKYDEMDVGKHKIVLSMDDNEPRYKASSVTKYITVKKASGKFSAPSVSRYYRESKNFVVKLTNSKTNKPIAYAKVTVKIFVDSRNYYQYTGYTNAEGKMNVNTDRYMPGTHKVEVTCADSKDYSASKVVSSLKVMKAPTKLSPTKLTAKYKASKNFKVKVINTKTNKAIAGVKVKIKVYTGKTYKTYTVKTNSKGIAQLNVKSLSVGTHKVVVSSADKYCTAKTATSSIKITKK